MSVEVNLNHYGEDQAMAPTNSNSEMTNLSYRLGAVEKDVGTLTKELDTIKTQLMQKATERENDLRFQGFDDKIQTILDDMREIKESNKESTVRKEQEQKDTAGELKSIRESISKIQIASLVFVLAWVLTIVGTIVAFLITRTIN